MHLYLDTTDGEHIILALANKSELLAVRTQKAQYRQSEKLLNGIDGLLKKAGKTRRTLTGIVVTTGPGKFTATRIGVATANALAYALGLPIVGVTHDDYQTTHDWIALGTVRLQNQQRPPLQAVEPAYGSEPNITPAKPRRLPNIR